MKKYFLLLVALFLGDALLAQDKLNDISASRRIPFISPTVPLRNSECKITKVMADVKISGNLAMTTLDIHISNPSSRMAEAVMLVPVPGTAVVKGLDFKGKAPESTASLIPKEQALHDYRRIVRQMQDPAIMEFINYGMIRTCVFPVDPNGTQKLRIVYEEFLLNTGGRIDYVLPRSESLEYKVPWEIIVTFDKIPDGNIYSPSHKIKSYEGNKRKVILLDKIAETEPGAFLLSFTSNKNQVVSYLYPDPKLGSKNAGFFLVAGRVPELPADMQPEIRELIIVLDRSGSMRGRLITQAKEASKQLLNALKDGDRFNIVIYNELVDCYNPKTTVVKNDESLKDAFEYIDSFNVSGGTNIHDALVEALMMKSAIPEDKHIARSIVFLTDGLPNIGQVRESSIRDAVLEANSNPFRHIYTFGVGTNVNVPLLDHIAMAAKGRSTYILPNEHIGLKVASISSKLNGFIYTEMKTAHADDAKLDTLLPYKEAYAGEQLVVTGTYKTPESNTEIPFSLDAKSPESTNLMSLKLVPSDASVNNAFVARIHASRRIALLNNAIRELGLDGDENPNPRKVKELVDEIVRLSLEYGVLSEYTAFFATEGSLNDTELHHLSDMRYKINENSSTIAKNVQRERSGDFAVVNTYNAKMMSSQDVLNRRNYRMDNNLELHMPTGKPGIQQLNDGQSLIRKGSRFVQGAVFNKKQTGSLTPDTVVNYGTKEYDKLMDVLIASNRQSVLGFNGEIIIELNGKIVQINNIINEEE